MDGTPEEISAKVQAELEAWAKTPERRRETAYHEAGHATMHWLLGTYGDLRGIDMQPNEGSLGRVSSKNIFDPTHIQSWVESHPRIGRLKAATGIMHMLAGPCSANLATEKAAGWLQDEFDCGEWEDDEGSDLQRAVRLAFAAFGERGPKPWTFLARVGRWTDECFAHPRTWAVVEALAARLTEADHMDADAAWDVMDAAWGAGGTIPILELGRNW
jgi:hypothetical protein